MKKPAYAPYQQAPYCRRSRSAISRFGAAVFSCLGCVAVCGLMLWTLTSCNLVETIATRSPNAGEGDPASSGDGSDTSTDSSQLPADTSNPTTDPDTSSTSPDSSEPAEKDTPADVQPDTSAPAAAQKPASTTPSKTPAKTPTQTTPKPTQPANPSTSPDQTTPPVTSRPVELPAAPEGQEPTTIEPSVPQPPAGNSADNQGSPVVVAPGAVGGGSAPDTTGDAQNYPIPPLDNYGDAAAIPVTQPPIDPKLNQGTIPEPD